MSQWQIFYHHDCNAHFLQHNYLRLVVLGRCSLVVVMKFQNKFASLRQLNSPIAEISFKYVVS